MKKVLLPLFCFLISLTASSQNGWPGEVLQYFDGNDTIPYHTLGIVLNVESNTDSVWQIGPPQKSLFDTASTAPNVLVTDTLSAYPTNSSASFELRFPQTFIDELINSYGILAIQWNQKLDLDSLNDGGMIEFSIDSGTTWENAFNSPYTYNYYGWSPENIGSIGIDSLAFTGTDSVWRNVWLCFEMGFLEIMGTENLRIRYRLVSDSIETNQEGWMLDNFNAHITWVHTIGEIEQEEYLVVYPNPSNGRIHIQAQKKREFHIIEQLEVYNLQGQLVKSFENVPTKFFVELNDQPNGTYIVKVKTNFETKSFPIVLQKE